MAIQPTPPIQLDPSMDEGHKLAFINQNFQSIANVLQQNSFVIVGTGTITTTAVTTSNPGAGNFANASSLDSIDHNLGYIPIFLAYYQLGSTYYQIPRTLNGGSGTTASWVNISAYATSTSLVIDTEVMAYGAAATRDSRTVKYFLLQQTAS